MGQGDPGRQHQTELSAYQGSGGNPRINWYRPVAKAAIAETTDAGVVEQLTKLGIEPNDTTPEEFSAQLAREQPQFDVAIEAAK